ncbi:MAG: hypothetical protein KAG04_01420 [Mycoplasmataceae bacterium]|nr:hypothetical protein [Mycoplasmataceae bacterium]
MTNIKTKTNETSATFVLELNVNEYRRLTVLIKEINRTVPKERFVDWFMEDLLFEFPNNGIQQRWTLDDIKIIIGKNDYSDSELEMIKKDFSTISNWDVFFEWK